MEEHKKNGANLSVDISYQYLTYFEEDDDKLEFIKEEYGSGRIGTGKVKGILCEKIEELLLNHQENRSKITDECIKKFMSIDKFNKDWFYNIIL